MSWLTWALLSALFAGLTAILAKVGVQDVDSNLALAIRTTVILVFTWALALALNVQALHTITTRSWVFLVLSGLATGASWLCYFRALQLGDASKVAPIDKLSVVVVMVVPLRETNSRTTIFVPQTHANYSAASAASSSSSPSCRLPCSLRSSSATRKASSSAWPALRRGSQWVW